MATTTPLTAEQLLTLPSHDGRCELVAGELRRMSPSGWRHGEVICNLHTILGQHIREKRLGKIFGVEAGFLLGRNPDMVLAPDISFIARERLPQSKPKDAFWPGAPDLVVEVLSPSDKTGEVDEKVQAWLAAGSRLIWVLDPQLETVTVYRSATDIAIKTSADVLDGGDVVSGFHCDVAEIFAPIA